MRIIRTHTYTYSWTHTMDISDWFSQTVGVRQGCTLSPDLFNLFLEHILSEAKEGFDSEFGIRANGERFTDLCFADDIDIMSETVESAQSMLQQINDASSRYGMDIVTHWSCRGSADANPIATGQSAATHLFDVGSWKSGSGLTGV